MTIVTTETEGLFFPLTIDGQMVVEARDANVFPASFQPSPKPIQAAVDTLDGGSQVFHPTPGVGHSDALSRFTFTLSFNSLNGPMKTIMEKIAASSRLHDLTFWKPSFALYTGDGSGKLLYLPRFRRAAPQIYPSLVWRGISSDAATFPTTVKIASIPKVVSYSDVLPLVDPGAGNVVISSQFDSTGYAPMLLGDAPAVDDEVELLTYFLYLVRLTDVRVEHEGFEIERHTYMFEER